jgi:hypothetical protein
MRNRFQRWSHSCINWLSANPTANVVIFDIWQHNYSNAAEQYIMNHPTFDAKRRLKIVKGSSLETVPDFHRENLDFKCDILSVDGGHTFEIALQDIKNMRYLARRAHNILFIDDSSCSQPYCVDAAIYEASKLNLVKSLEGISLHKGLRGIGILTYV